MNKDRFKFRVWEPQKNHMNYLDWLDTSAGAEPKCMIQLVYFRDCLLYPDDATIMQCTGLKDSGGNLIWEEDVVKKYREVNKDFGFDLYRINWNLARCCFDMIPIEHESVFKYGFLLYKTREKLEVIGNIYENPELLK